MARDTFLITEDRGHVKLQKLFPPRSIGAQAGCSHPDQKKAALADSLSEETTYSSDDHSFGLIGEAGPSGTARPGDWRTIGPGVGTGVGAEFEAGLPIGTGCEIAGPLGAVPFWICAL